MLYVASSGRGSHVVMTVSSMSLTQAEGHVRGDHRHPAAPGRAPAVVEADRVPARGQAGAGQPDVDEARAVRGDKERRRPATVIVTDGAADLGGEEVAPARD